MIVDFCTLANFKHPADCKCKLEELGMHPFLPFQLSAPRKIRQLRVHENVYGRVMGGQGSYFISSREMTVAFTPLFYYYVLSFVWIWDLSLFSIFEQISCITGVRPVESLSVLTSRICPIREDIGMRTASSAGVVRVRKKILYIFFVLLRGAT